MRSDTRSEPCVESRGKRGELTTRLLPHPEPVLLAAFFAGFVLQAIGTWRMVVRSHVVTQS